MNATKPFDSKPSESDLKFDTIIQKGTQEAQDISAQREHSQDDKRQ